jgi:hypothetical protein
MPKDQPVLIATLSNRQLVWLVSASSVAGACVFAWTVRDAARDGSVTVFGRYFAQTFTKDDQPVQFLFAFLANCIACVGCLVLSVSIHFLPIH